MKYVDLLKLFREKLNSQCADDHYAALLFALQLPSICGRMEFPKTEKNTGKNGQNSNILYRENGNPWDKNLYFAWLKKHKNCFMHIPDREPRLHGVLGSVHIRASTISAK